MHFDTTVTKYCVRVAVPMTAAFLASTFAGCAKPPQPRESTETVSGSFYRTMVYACDGGASFTARFDGDSLHLRGAGETRMLPQTPAASGTRYADTGLVFWIHGPEASLEKAASPPVLCRYDSVATAWEQAWARGVSLRATGAEIVAKGKIDWVLEITKGKVAVFSSENGRQRAAFQDTAKFLGPTDQRVYGEGSPLAVEWVHRPCREGGSGEPLDLVVKVEYAGKKYQGCGRTAHP